MLTLLKGGSMLAMSSLPFSFRECVPNFTNISMNSGKDALSGVHGRCDVYLLSLVVIETCTVGARCGPYLQTIFSVTQWAVAERPRWQDGKNFNILNRVSGNIHRTLNF